MMPKSFMSIIGKKSNGWVFMKRILVKSVHGAFGYVMEHYYPFGMADEAAEQ